MVTPPNRQDRLLEAADGRYYAIGKGGTGLAMIATTEEVGGADVSFGLPSAPALFLHLAHEAFEAYRGINARSLFDSHSQGIWPDDQGPLFDFCERFAAHVVFSFTALESFANELIPDGYSYTMTEAKTGETVAYERDEVERRVSLNEKLSQLLPDALGVGSPKGLHIWRDFVNLKKIRDRLIHLKSADRGSTGPEIETVWGHMLRNAKEPYCDNAHKLMSHFGPSVTERRWYKKYPY